MLFKRMSPHGKENTVLQQQCSGSGMFITDPDFNISDTVSQIQGQKDCGSEIPNPDTHQRIFVFLTQKIVSKLSKI
jgi:hypothetical protein